MEENEAAATNDLEGDDDLLDPEAEEDEDMALNLASSTNGPGGMPDLQILQMRLASATRALADWKAHSQKTGKSRSEVYEQLLEDICNYYGYNRFLAEKLLELFPIEEVSHVYHVRVAGLTERYCRRLPFLMRQILRDQ